MMDRKYGLFVASWKPRSTPTPKPVKPIKEVPPTLTGEEFRLERRRPYYQYAQKGYMRPATVEEYIKWCKSNWPSHKDGADRYRYVDRLFNDPSNEIVDLWYMLKPFRIPSLHGADSFDIIIPNGRWMTTCVPTEPNPYMKHEKYPDIGHNAVYGPHGTTGKWDIIEAFDHPWFHKRYPITVEKSLAEDYRWNLECEGCSAHGYLT